MATHLFQLAPHGSAAPRLPVAAHRLALTTGAVRSFAAPLLHSISVERGRVWITCDGDATDHLLSAGDVYVPSSPGLIVVEAFTPAVIEVDQG